MDTRGLCNINRVPDSTLISVLTGVLLILIHFLHAIGQEEQKKDAWKDTLRDGTTITKRYLSKIFEEHNKWINTARIERKRADLSEANLKRAKLADSRGAADLSEAILCRSNLSGAYLSRVNLTRANLSEATLDGAILHVPFEYTISPLSSLCFVKLMALSTFTGFSLNFFSSLCCIT